MSPGLAIAQEFVRYLSLENATAFDPDALVLEEQGLVLGGSSGQTFAEAGFIHHKAAVGGLALPASVDPLLLSFIPNPLVVDSYRVSIEAHDGIISSDFSVNRDGRYEIRIRGEYNGGVTEGSTNLLPVVPGYGSATGSLEISGYLHGDEPLGRTVANLRKAPEWEDLIRETAVYTAVMASLNALTGVVDDLVNVLVATRDADLWQSDALYLRSSNYLRAGEHYRWDISVDSWLWSTGYVNSAGTALYDLTLSDLSVELWYLGEPTMRTAYASAGPNGSISPSGAASVEHGETVNLYATPDIGFEVDTWFVDGIDEGGSVSGITLFEDRTVLVTFKELPLPDFPLTTFEVLGFDFYDGTDLDPKNNGDGMLQSGEEAELRPILRNSGETAAREVEAAAFAPGPGILEARGILDYPDLMPSVASRPDGNDSLEIKIEPGFAGSTSVGLLVEWADGSGVVELPSALVLDVEAAAWGNIENDEFNFGLVPPETIITFSMGIQNYGSTSMQVTGFNVTDGQGSPVSDTTASIENLNVAAGQTMDVQFEIDTTGLDGPIVRQVAYVTTGRLRRPEHAEMTVSGYVASGDTAIHTIDGSTDVSAADIGSEWIVWSRGGDIFALNLITGEEQQLTDDDADQRNPRVSNGLVAWEDSRNESGVESNYDIYGYDLLLDEHLVISNNSADEVLAGVDNGRVAFAREYHEIDRENWWASKLFNMWLFDSSTGEAINLTGYQPAGNNPMRSVNARGAKPDLGDNLLVWADNEVYPNNASWGVRNSRVMKFDTELDTGVGVAVPATSFVSGYTRRFAASDGSFAWVAWTPEHGRGDSISVWTNGSSVLEIYEPSVQLGEDSFAMGGGFIAYDRRDAPGVFYWNMAQNEPGLLTTQDDVSGVQMNENGIVWKAGDGAGRQVLQYAFIENSEIAIGWVDWDLSQEDLIDVSIQVYNLSDYEMPDTIFVRLYDGHPDGGGTQIGTEAEIVGGLEGGASEVVDFTGVSLDGGGPIGEVRQVYARVSVLGYDNPSNNTIMLVPEPSRLAMSICALISLVGIFCWRRRQQLN